MQTVSIDSNDFGGSALRGRSDIVVDHPCGTYIFELKVNKLPTGPSGLWPSLQR